MFTKLKNNFLDVDWKKFKSDTLVDSHYSNVRKGGSYFYMVQHKEELWSMYTSLFTILPHKVSYCEFTGGSLITPHRDKADTVAMNLYIETDNATTIFYKEILPNPESTKIKYIKPYVPSMDNLIETSTFTANHNDLYLLDVNEIHGIQKTTTNLRTMITFRWVKYTFSEILNSLNI